MNKEGLKGWLPYQLDTRQQPSVCKWLYAGNKHFSQPFFLEEIGSLKSSAFSFNPKGYLSLSTPELLPAWAQGIEAIEPSAFIFHISRCGSTLAAQLLGTVDRHIVLSEVPFFDGLLRGQDKLNDSGSFNELFKAAMTFYGQKRTGNEEKLFIKTDCWHLIFYEQLRQMYPHVPFILLYRRPDEVMRSQQKCWGTHAVPGLIDPELYGFHRETILQMHPDEYLAKVLEYFYERMLHIAATDANAVLINYNEGAFAIVKKITAITNSGIAAGEWRDIEERSRYHSKYPGQAFKEHDVQDAMPVYLHRAAGLYNELEKMLVSS